MRWEDLETRLAEIYLKRAEKVAFVRGDADVDFQYVADVIDVAHPRGSGADWTAHGTTRVRGRVGAGFRNRVIL